MSLEETRMKSIELNDRYWQMKFDEQARWWRAAMDGCEERRSEQFSKMKSILDDCMAGLTSITGEVIKVRKELARLMGEKPDESIKHNEVQTCESEVQRREKVDGGQL
jgi:hypothetical protein